MFKFKEPEQVGTEVDVRVKRDKDPKDEVETHVLCRCGGIIPPMTYAAKSVLDTIKPAHRKAVRKWARENQGIRWCDLWMPGDKIAD